MEISKSTRVLTVILCVLFFCVLVYSCIYFKSGLRDYFEYLEDINSELVNKKTAQLINANTLANLPDINIITNNVDINRYLGCANNPIKLTNLEPDVLESTCFEKCGNAAQVVTIAQGDEYFYNNVRLDPGNWCLYDIPDCNPKTASYIGAVGGVTCQSKFPELFDNQGYNIIACNSTEIYNSSNILWDNLLNEPVVPTDTSISNVDELLPNGTYRFTCKYGYDDRGNQLLPHPLNRFIPIKDNCISKVKLAHVDAKVEFSKDSSGNTTYKCNCGNYQDTRLKNEDENDEQSACSPCIFSKTDGPDKYTTVSIPFKCFNLSSTMSDITTARPCYPSKYTDSFTPCDTLKLTCYYPTMYMADDDMYNLRIDLSVMPLSDLLTDSISSRNNTWVY